LTENEDNVTLNKHFKCPYCACIFLTEIDLKKHLGCMGDHKEEHLDNYRRTHGRIEHGSYGNG
jgi:SET domain-containing protein